MTCQDCKRYDFCSGKRPCEECQDHDICNVHCGVIETFEDGEWKLWDGVDQMECFENGEENDR